MRYEGKPSVIPGQTKRPCRRREFLVNPLGLRNALASFHLRSCLGSNKCLRECENTRGRWLYLSHLLVPTTTLPFGGTLGDSGEGLLSVVQVCVRHGRSWRQIASQFTSHSPLSYVLYWRAMKTTWLPGFSRVRCRFTAPTQRKMAERERKGE